MVFFKVGVTSTNTFAGSSQQCILADYYSTHPPFDSASTVVIAAIGTTSLAVEYGEVCPVSFIHMACAFVIQQF